MLDTIHGAFFIAGLSEKMALVIEMGTASQSMSGILMDLICSWCSVMSSILLSGKLSV